MSADATSFDLRGYLIRTFLLATVGALAGEVIALWVEAQLLVPTTSSLVTALGGGALPLDVLSLLQGLPGLLRLAVESIFVPGMRLTLAGAELMLLLLAELLLIMLPVAIASLAFALQASRRISALQAAHDEERRRAEEQRNLVVADMAHDLRTPITSIVGLSQALADGMVTDQAQRQECLRTISSEASTVSDMVTLLLEYSQLDSTDFRLQLARVDLAELLRQVAAATYATAEREGMFLAAHVPEEPCWIQADATQLHRVCANLVANAIRHNPRGTTIGISLELRGDVALASVADTGVPLDQSLQELLRPFSRGDASRASEGFGLGLSVAKRICDMHGFGFTLRQPAGAYTKAFIVTCPLAE